VVVLDRLEVSVLHCVLGSDTFGVVILKHPVEQVKGFFSDELVILGVDELLPRLAGLVAEDVVEVRVEGHAVFLDVGEKLICAEELRNFNELVVVVLALEERFLLEDHASEHASERPNIEGVVVHLQFNQQLGSLEVARSDTDVVLLTGMVKLGETPIDEAELAVGVVDHDVMRLHITMHNALGVAEVEGLQDLEHVVADVEVSEALVQGSKVNVTCVHVLHDQSGSFRHWVAHHVYQVDDIDSTSQRLQNLDFSSDFGLLDYNQQTKQSQKEQI